MSQFAPAPHKPDSRIFASYPMPAKIDLINERPRRESQVEEQLEHRMGESYLPKIEVSTTQQRQYETWSQQAPLNNQYQEKNVDFNQREHQSIANMVPQQSTQINQQQQNTQQFVQHHREQDQYQPVFQQRQQQQHYQQYQQQPQQQQLTVDNIGSQDQVQNSRTTTTTYTTVTKTSNNAAILAAELAEKEAKLMADITALHQRPYSPFQVPAKIDLTSEQRIAQQQYQNAPSPRPFSRASSTKSTSADLLDKEAKLLQEIEEMEKKPFNPQKMVVEREQWFEYPEGRPYERQLTDSKRRVKDFCSLPSYMYPDQGKHIHEENLPATALGRPSTSANSMHTTIIRSPRREIDNKSPLPFAFDNFSTKGVRGNIASVGAIEPDRPRPPIYPIIKRTPSPSMARG